MGWTELQPDTAASPGAVAVMMSATAAVGRFRRRVTVTVRTALRPALPWFKPGAHVAVALGTQADAGTLRIAPQADGSFVVRACGGRGNSGPNASVMLVLPPFASMKPEAQVSRAVAHAIEGQQLLITLPAWACLAPTSASEPEPEPAAPARGREPVPQAEQRTAGRPPNGATPPFRSLASQEPDPRVRKIVAQVGQPTGRL